MPRASLSRPGVVLSVGILLALIGLGAIAYMPKDEPLVLAGATATVMLGYLLGRWAVQRMAQDQDR